MFIIIINLRLDTLCAIVCLTVREGTALRRKPPNQETLEPVCSCWLERNNPDVQGPGIFQDVNLEW